MSERCVHGREPVRIPVPGGKVIEELIGRASTGDTRLSVAHMVAPPGWGEPPQTPEFDELTIQLRGRSRLELGSAGEVRVVELAAGETLWVPGGTRVRYSNPFDEEGEYWAVCWPAFSVDSAHRE